MGAPDSGSYATLTSTLGGNLTTLLQSEDLEPGSDPSYELCKLIYLYHPLGAKMAEAPVSIAQSQQREIAIPDAPQEAIEAFWLAWRDLRCDQVIHNCKTLSRVYGIATIAALTDGDLSKPIDYDKLADQDVTFNVLDPLNTAGSLVLDQNPISRDFAKPVQVRTMGTSIHPSRYVVVMNENPIYIAYTQAAFGFVGRSVYQRALFPLKSFIQSMLADDMIATKLGLLIAKQKQAGSVIDNVMGKIFSSKRALLKEAQTGQVLSIGTEESIETLNMMNVDNAGKYSRDNILKNVATAADMPAVLLSNETLTAGFGEGTEDAKTVALYIHRVRESMEPEYSFLDKITMRKAWTADFVARMQKKYPERYRGRGTEDILSEWRSSFQAAWPSMLIEPESEQIKVEDVKFQAVVAMCQTLIEELDPINKGAVIQWACDTISENKTLFPRSLTLDFDELEDYLDQEPVDQGAEGEETRKVGAEAKKFGRFDSLDAIRRSVAKLDDRRSARK